jgi:hypothetical protein
MLAASVSFSGSAQAALGDDVSAVAKDRETLHATVRILPRADHHIHELLTPTGSVVREYVSPQTGKVFAVSWSGRWRPDLGDIMGSYYERFVESQRGKRRARGPVRIELPGMVVFTGGYLRTFFGHVYLTDQLPAGFDPQSIR